MSPEVAMEQYIKLLSDIDPGWMQDSSSVVSISCIEFWSFCCRSIDRSRFSRLFHVPNIYLSNFQDDGKQEFVGSPDTEKALLEDVRGDAGDQR